MKYKNRIAIDLRYAEEKNSGLTRFSKNIFLNLIKKKSTNTLFFYIILPPFKNTLHLNEFYNLKNDNINIINWKKKRGWKWKIGIYYFDFKLYLYLIKNKVNIYLTPFIDPPFLPFINIISTIHDLTFIKVKKFFPKLNFLKKIIGEIRIITTIIISKYIITVSKSTKQLLIKRYNYLPIKYQKKLRNIYIIPNGITPFRSIDNVKLPVNLPDKFFLYVGDRRPHKNLQYLINLIKKINYISNENIFLIIAGSKSYENSFLQKIIINNNEFILEFVNPTDQQLKYLYKKCNAFFLLSLSEGFGIPVIEAGANGCKVILNSIPALKEIAPTNSLFINCESLEIDSKKIIKYLRNSKRSKKEEVLNKWKWANSSKLMSDFLLDIC